MADESTTAPAPTETPTAVEAAVVASDYQSFEKAQMASDAGKPLEAPAPPAPAEAERTLSKRQQEANARTAKAVEAATADLRAENARLRSTAAPPAPAPPKPAVAAPVPSERFASFQEFVAQKPDASLEDWLEARDDWRDQRRERTAAQRQEQAAVTETSQATMARASEQLKAKTTASPEFAQSLNPRLLQIQTFADAERDGVQAGPSNVIAEELFKSDALIPLLEHFTAHPDAFTRLETVPDVYAKLPPRQRAAAHAQWIVREMGKIEATLTPATAAAEVSTPKPKTVSTAPAPPVDLGPRQTQIADPIASAVKANDYAAFEAAERAKRSASMLPRR